MRRVIAYVLLGLAGIYSTIGFSLTHAIAVSAPQIMTKNAQDQLMPRNPHIPLIASLQKSHSASTSQGALDSAVDCTAAEPAHDGLASAKTPELQKLAQYEAVCHSAIADTVSFFTSIPTTTAEASSYAGEVSTRLKEFASYHIHPLVFLEPTTSSGGLIDMATYQSGAYDSALQAYFAALKSAGVTDESMGTWVPFPEGNTPVWTSLNPGVFTACVTKTVQQQKAVFPTSHASVMLDSISYPTSGSWDGGHAVSFLPYVQNLPAGLIESFGLQGFPWQGPANQPADTNGDAQMYLRVDLAAEAARALHTTQIWLNTGTFRVKYVDQPGAEVIATPARRSQLLTETIGQLETLQRQGFSVSLHLFAQNKSGVDEATDWSYWPSGQAATSPHSTVFAQFVHQLQARHIPLWLFDADT